MFKRFHEKFTGDYIAKAIKLNILTQEEVDKCIEIELNKSNK